ncbi:hypothetical protein [Actinosynnema sp.]|uniref:hypothetical protein n=1 Tax=Actinosynnema sp. TaxID=1872144 RepID=UPI003F85B1EF
MTTRPTLRCPTGELGMSPPPAEAPLGEVDHPLPREAALQLADPTGTRERISAIDDTVFFKIKAQRWRGAAWTDGNGQAWLVAAGQREEGSKDDFSESLATAARVARTRYNSEHSPPPRSPRPGCRTTTTGTDSSSRRACASSAS